MVQTATNHEPTSWRGHSDRHGGITGLHQGSDISIGSSAVNNLEACYIRARADPEVVTEGVFENDRLIDGQWPEVRGGDPGLPAEYGSKGLAHQIHIKLGHFNALVKPEISTDDVEFITDGGSNYPTSPGAGSTGAGKLFNVTQEEVLASLRSTITPLRLSRFTLSDEGESPQGTEFHNIGEVDLKTVFRLQVEQSTIPLT